MTVIKDMQEIQPEKWVKESLDKEFKKKYTVRKRGMNKKVHATAAMVIVVFTIGTYLQNRFDKQAEFQASNLEAINNTLLNLGRVESQSDKIISQNVRLIVNLKASQ